MKNIKLEREESSRKLETKTKKNAQIYSKIEAGTNHLQNLQYTMDVSE